MKFFKFCSLAFLLSISSFSLHAEEVKNDSSETYNVDHEANHVNVEMYKMSHMNGSQSIQSSTAAYEKANATMHHGMNIVYSGNADVDFVNGMIAHHQGAVDMAKVQLQYGKDPELKKLSQEIIESQEKEILFMKEWLKNNSK